MVWRLGFSQLISTSERWAVTWLGRAGWRRSQETEKYRWLYDLAPRKVEAVGLRHGAGTRQQRECDRESELKVSAG
jgi:hypothetical protein